MAKDEKKKKKKKEDSPEAAERPVETLDVAPGEQREEFEKGLEKEGLSAREASNRLEELLEASGDVKELEGVDQEILEHARERAEETGSVDDAARQLALEAESEKAAEASGESPESEAIPFDRLSEELGVSADTVHVTAKVDGEEVEVPLSEAVDGYQRQQDYSRKTQEVAEKREEVENLQRGYAQRLEALAVGLQQMGVNEEALRGIVNEYQKVAGAVQDQRKAQFAQTVQQEREALKEALDLESDEAFDDRRHKLREFATEDLGLSEQQLAAIKDHRAFVVLDEARRYRELQEKGGEIQNATPERSTPATLEPGSRPRGSSASSEEKARAAAKERLRRTGSVRDAAEALEGII